jgi:flagellar hook-associated protein 1 FlgK
MSLNSSLSIAQSGISAVTYELGVASQNVSNASTPGYVTEVANIASRDAGGQGSGVVIQLTSRAVNTTLQNALYAQNATVAGLSVTTNALNAVSSVQGSTSANAGASNTLADNLGNLANGFTTLESDPSSAVEQQSLVSSAATLANSIQTLSNTYQTQRQNAQNAIVSEVGSVNASLNTIGSLSQQIMRMQASGQNTADLENQRAAVMNTLSSSLSVKFVETPAGDMVVTAADGLVLPTNATSGPLSTKDATIGVGDACSTTPPGSIPAIYLNGQDVTASLTGGSLGANIILRDVTLPTMQGELDSFASTLANRFSAQGLTLFTDGSGYSPGASLSSPPPSGQLGFSASIQVNSAVVTTPSLVRDGNVSITGSPTGASAFTPNPSGGPVGFTTLISRILSYSFGTEVSPGVGQSPPVLKGLGVNGNLSAPYSAAGDLESLATTLTASQAQTINDATTQQTTQTDIQTNLQSNLTATSGVSVDDQMARVVALQNAYEANAKVVAAVQTMFTALLTAVS